MKHYHFIYSIPNYKVIGEVGVSELKNTTALNFPVKSFYSPVTNNCYTFYRQGHGFTISSSNPKEFRC